MAINYVKFQRGSTSAYELQKQHSRLDSDTLYFVYDRPDSESGKLYLGSKLISGVGNGTGITSVADLTDVILTDVGANDFLICNSDGKWINKSAEDIADIIAAQAGLALEVNENVFILTSPGAGTLSNLNLVGFDSAESGAFAMKGTDGTLIWSKPDFSELESRVGSLEDSINGLDELVATKVSELNTLTYSKVESLEDMTKENTVYLLQNVNGTDNNLYSEYMVLDGKVEKLGDWSVNLDGYATTEALQSVSDDLVLLQSVVGDITLLNNYNAEAPTTIVDEINAINERLTWGEIPSSI